jgi:hypothetical protein
VLSRFDRRVIRAALRPAKRIRGRPRIAVVGNCQCPGLAYAINLLKHEASVDHFPIQLGSKTPVAAFCRLLHRYDHVFAHEFPQGYLAGGDSADLGRELRNLRSVPSISFSAFHPDLVYAHDQTRGGFPSESLTGHYHSALAIYAFLGGYSVDESRGFFAGNVFHYLGYLNVWASASEALRQEGLKFDLDLNDAATRWSRRGVFMHSLNHPKPFVLLDVAHRLLDRAGIRTRQEDLASYMPDTMMEGEGFPIYPEIGAFYGEEGAYVFRDRTYNFHKGDYTFYDLRGFLAASFQRYRRMRPEQFHCARVEGWRNDPAIVATLEEMMRCNVSRAEQG